MSLTVARALGELPILSTAEVVAGDGGLDRVIRWTHIVDFPEVAPWVRAENLLLTTAFALKDDSVAQLELVPVLAQKGLAGMIVAVGPYMQDIPADMARLADELDFPIIALPFEVPFVDVTRAIHERIIREQFALIKQSMHIHKVLTQLVLEGKGLEAISDALASLLDCSVTIEDASLRVLAHASPGPVDEIRQRSIAEGSTPRELVAYLETQSLFDRLRTDPRPQRVPPVPELGMTLERIIMPILVGDHLYGYVWIVGTEGSLTELDFLAIERAATVAALAMTREHAVYEAEQRLKSGLLDSLLDLDPQQELHELVRILERLSLSQGYQVIVVEPVRRKPLGLVRITEFIEREIETSGLHFTVIERGQRLVVLLGTIDSHSVRVVAESVLEVASRCNVPLLIGLGIASNEVGQVRQCYQQAIEALSIGKALSGGEPGVWMFEELGFLQWLKSVPVNVRATNRYCRLVSALASRDEEHGTDMLRTLEVFLDCSGNMQQAARKLFVHRNTLRQRLDKLRKAWDLNLSDPHILLNLHIAIKDWHLSRGG